MSFKIPVTVPNSINPSACLYSPSQAQDSRQESPSSPWPQKGAETGQEEQGKAPRGHVLPQGDEGWQLREDEVAQSPPTPDGHSSKEENVIHWYTGCLWGPKIYVHGSSGKKLKFQCLFLIAYNIQIRFWVFHCSTGCISWDLKWDTESHWCWLKDHLFSSFYSQCSPINVTTKWTQIFFNPYWLPLNHTQKQNLLVNKANPFYLMFTAEFLLPHH